MRSREPLRMAKATLVGRRRPSGSCDHVFRDTAACVYCGWIPPVSVPDATGYSWTDDNLDTTE